MAKKQKGFNKAVLMPLFIVFIMIMSAFGYMWGSSKTRLDYNGFKFYQLEQTGFLLKIESQRIQFNYHPLELEKLNATEGIGNIFATPMFYATYNESSDYAETIAEIQFNLGQIMDTAKGRYVQNAFVSENEYNLPVVDCKDATANVPVLKIEKSNSTEIILEGRCAVLRARTRPEMSMVYERLLYSILGVME